MKFSKKMSRRIRRRFQKRYIRRAVQYKNKRPERRRVHTLYTSSHRPSRYSVSPAGRKRPPYSRWTAAGQLGKGTLQVIPGGYNIYRGIRGLITGKNTEIKNYDLDVVKTEAGPLTKGARIPTKGLWISCIGKRQVTGASDFTDHIDDHAGIIQGTQRTQRLADTIRIKSITFQFTVYKEGNTTDTSTVVRILLFYDRSYRGELYYDTSGKTVNRTLFDDYSTSNVPWLFYNRIYAGKHQVLMDKTVNVIHGTNASHKNIKGYMPLNLKIAFDTDDPAPVAANPLKNNLIFCIMSTDGTETEIRIRGRIRVTYWDD